MTSIAPDPHWTPNTFQFDVNASEPGMGMDINIAMMINRPERDPMLPDASEPSRATLQGTVFGQPVDQAFTAAKTAAEQVALSNVFTELSQLEVRADAHLLAVGEQLAPNSARLLFEAPVMAVQGFPSDETPPPPRTAMFVVDFATLDTPKYEAFGQAFEAYTKLAFPELGGDAMDAAQAVSAAA